MTFPKVPNRLINPCASGIGGGGAWGHDPSGKPDRLSGAECRSAADHPSRISQQDHPCLAAGEPFAAGAGLQASGKERGNAGGSMMAGLADLASFTS